jgi:crotonobetainyl-CoA:carnitine CoA-transferase CaiB-like acyl-CoA transferase
VLAALASPEHGRKAICIEAPMYESLVSFLLLEQLGGRTFDPPLGGIGYDRLLSPYRKPFRTQDGFISIVPYTAQHWTRFLGLVGREQLAADRRVVDPVERSRNIDMLYAIIEESTPQHTTDEWIVLLRELDIPHARVNRLDELFDDPHLRQAGMFAKIDHPTEGSLVSVRSPFSILGDGPAAPDRLAPTLGQDTREILAEAGLEADAVEHLIGTGAVLADATEKAAAG